MEPADTDQTEQWPETQPTQQATQNVVDPRRLGKQNSGFSDDEIADIVCLLLPFSEGARAELREMAMRTSKHMVEADEAAHPDLATAEGLDQLPQLVGEQAIVLRLSASVKDPLAGFTFGRNAMRSDVHFDNDPLRRLSNIHFRIYINEYGVLMIEDCSINGTIIDGTMLRARDSKGLKPGEKKLPRQRTLNSGSQVKILMAERDDDFTFVVHIPPREGDCEVAYRRNLSRYLRRLQRLRAEHDAVDAGKTITPGPTGHVDLFPANEATKRTTPRAVRHAHHADDHPEEDLARLPRQWTGSGRYNVVGQIGKGAFATVYRVTSKFDGRPWAAKELDKRKFMKNGVLDQKVENEMKIMQRVKHPNIVEYHEHLDWDDRLLYIIMEFIPNGDLGSLIGENGALREGIVQDMTSQLLSALAYLHTNNITHRDVKPDNILVQSFNPFIVKLTDFGLSKMVDTEQTFLKTFCGTLLYCAPEVYNEYAEYDEYGHRHPRNRQRRRPIGQRYDHAIDIWSLGGVLYYAMTGDPPYPAKNGISYTELLHQIMTKKLNTQPLTRFEISQDGVDFINRMLQRRPEQRATGEELRDHPWLQHTSFSQEQPGAHEELLDDELGKEASQLSLEDRNGHNEEAEDDLKPYEAEIFEYSEFAAYESPKENYTFVSADAEPRQRLFGEVSTIGPSGVVSAIRLDLPVAEQATEVMDSVDIEIKDSFGSEDSTPREQRKSQNTPRATLPAALTQSSRSVSRSVSDLNNMTFDVASQDLGGAESQLENLNMKSLVPSHLQSHYTSFHSSKRKPPADRSDDFDATPRAKPPVKRLKSESVVDAMSVDEEVEQNLYSQVPPLLRVNSNRQIDRPVHKSTYWDARDKKSWHLHYPEMTQLQHDAFVSAAKARGEVFAPGRSPLWDLAMRHFPPAVTTSMTERTDSSTTADSASDTSSKASDTGFPAPRPEPLAVGIYNVDDDSMPDTLPPDYSAYAPAQADPPLNRIVATLESEEGSVVSGILVLINQAMVSWGRATDNTHVYTPRIESKVPKYGLKIILWKEGYEPYKNFRPWNNNASDDYAFYISTKATHGIQVNRTILQSHDPKSPRGPSQKWIKLHDGDSVVFWRTGDDEEQVKAKLTFRCIWGGSARSRTQPAQLVSPDIAECLDASCRKAEERIGKLAEYDLRLQEADMDATDRQRNIERERLRSQNFESKRLEACRVVAMRVSRRGSPSSLSSSTSSSPFLSPPGIPPSASAPPTVMAFGGVAAEGGGLAAGAEIVPKQQKSIPTLRHANHLKNLNGRTLHAMAEGTGDRSG